MSTVEEITLDELPEWLSDKDCQLIDIRETEEFAEFNLGGINIPSHLINENVEKLSAYTTLIIACSNGTRSHILARVYRKKFPGKRILHLKDGIS